MLPKNKLKWISRIICSIVIICFVISLFGTWWFHKYSIDGVLEGEEENSKGNRIKEFGTTGVHAKGDGYIIFEGEKINLTVEKEFQYETNEFHDYFGWEYGHFADIFIPIFYFVIISIIMSIIIFIVLMLEIKNKYKSIFFLLGFFITIIAPIYLVISFYNFLPEAPLAFPEDEFMGYKESEVSKSIWGPGYAWYFSFIGSILLLALSIIHYREWKKGSKVELHDKKSQKPDLGRVEIMFPE